VVKDVVTFGTVFVGFSTELVFFRTHLISFSRYAGRMGSKLELWLCGFSNLALPNHFSFDLRISYVLGANDHLYISKTRLVTERTVSFVLKEHIDTLKVHS
jgi:hypothetical protein